MQIMENIATTVRHACIVARVIVLLGCVSLVGTGCSLMGVKHQMKTLDKVVYYTGTVETTEAAHGSLIVVLYAKSPQPSAVFFDLVPGRSGVYHLVAKPGDYGIIAFDDRNDDYQYTAGEPVAMLDGHPIDARHERDAATEGHIMLSAANTVEPRIVHDILGESFRKFSAERAKRFGEVTTLDDPRFAPERIQDGIYRPVEFLRDTGPGLFLLEPYDPSRIPVIFVHGSSGSPRVWQAAIASLDRSKFQACVYYYPSGLSLGFSAGVLNQAIEGLRARHRFDHCDIIAHSMGGLVTRGALNVALSEGRTPPVRHLVTISTPWLGQPGAKFAATAPMRVPPAWVDMSPDGAYVQQLFARPMPDSIRHTLFFSIGGHSSVRPGNNDGTVTLDSMLAADAQDHAEFVYGFDEDHVSILSSPAMLTKLAERLAIEAAPVK